MKFIIRDAQTNLLAEFVIATSIRQEYVEQLLRSYAIPENAYSQPNVPLRLYKDSVLTNIAKSIVYLANEPAATSLSMNGLSVHKYA